MNYEDMSDFQINSAVAENVLWNIRDCEEIYYNDKAGICSWADGANWHEFDPCNNPSDAWPIIAGMIANGCVVQILQAGVIVILQDGGRIQFMDKNPLRAAMIVFLMMQEQSK